jgi:hypothetical protein
VDFIDNPKFEGRNTILAAVNEEPLFALNLQIKNVRCLIQRSFDGGMTFPPVSEDGYNLFSQLKVQVFTYILEQLQNQQVLLV